MSRARQENAAIRHWNSQELAPGVTARSGPALVVVFQLCFKLRRQVTNIVRHVWVFGLEQTPQSIANSSQRRASEKLLFIVIAVVHKQQNDEMCSHVPMFGTQHNLLHGVILVHSRYVDLKSAEFESAPYFRSSPPLISRSRGQAQ